MTTSAAKESVGSDSVRLYLNEIGQVELLTAEEEKDLGKKIKSGLVAQEKLNKTHSELGFSERRRLQRIVKEGEKAKDHMVRANLRLVVSVARRYDRKELQLADLIQEGNIGLMHAADKYDFEKGFKFSTYATWWIRQSMTRALADQGRNIRIPGHMMEVVNRVQRAERDLTAELGRLPTPEEVATRSSLSVEKLLDIMQLAIPTTSLDAPVGYNTDDLTVGDTIADTDDNDPLGATERAQ
ncbi:MAG: sigma-70 family RNA polymerase sigma factor, partial [Actinobacteria bacterium]|nr:sigma-70 family RNA polymerase sigma factor [Actinomycetota bacterium]